MQAMICHEIFTDRDYLQSIIFSLLTDVHPGTGGLSCRSATRWGPACCNLWLALQEFRWTALRSSTGPTDLSCSPSRSGAAPPTIPELTLVSTGGASVWQINFLTICSSFFRLDLPPYESYQQLRDKLIKVMRQLKIDSDNSQTLSFQAIEGSEGFAGVDWIRGLHHYLRTPNIEDILVTYIQVTKLDTSRNFVR